MTFYRTFHTSLREKNADCTVLFTLLNGPLRHRPHNLWANRLTKSIGNQTVLLFTLWQLASIPSINHNQMLEPKVKQMHGGESFYAWFGHDKVIYAGASVFFALLAFLPNASRAHLNPRVISKLFYTLGLACTQQEQHVCLYCAKRLSSPAHATTGALAIILMIVHAVWQHRVALRKILQRLLDFIVSYWVGQAGLCLHLRHAHGNTGPCHDPTLAIGIAIVAHLVIGFIVYRCAKPRART